MSALFLVMCTTQPIILPHVGSVSFSLSSNLILKITADTPGLMYFSVDVTWCRYAGGLGHYMVMAEQDTAEDTVSFTPLVCCTITLEKRPEPASNWLTGTRTWRKHTNPPRFTYDWLFCLYIAVLISS